MIPFLEETQYNTPELLNAFLKGYFEYGRKMWTPDKEISDEMFEMLSEMNNEEGRKTKEFKQVSYARNIFLDAMS
ncbi:MAG: hypothetical protein ACRENZ_12195 [Thermodesulfobacteriota bacterium]